MQEQKFHVTLHHEWQTPKRFVVAAVTAGEAVIQVVVEHAMSSLRRVQVEPMHQRNGDG